MADRCEWCGTPAEDGVHHYVDQCREYLKAAIGSYRKDYDRGKLAGAAEERARISSELRQRANSLCLMRSQKARAAGATLFAYLVIIERGEHAQPAAGEEKP
jgi:hypothetical protein